jgi:hypothetical protein
MLLMFVAILFSQHSLAWMRPAIADDSPNQRKARTIPAAGGVIAGTAVLLWRSLINERLRLKGIQATLQDWMHFHANELPNQVAVLQWGIGCKSRCISMQMNCSTTLPYCE